MIKSISIFIVLLMFFFQTFGQDILANLKNAGLADRVTKEYQKYRGYVDENKLDLILE